MRGGGANHPQGSRDGAAPPGGALFSDASETPTTNQTLGYSQQPNAAQYARYTHADSPPPHIGSARGSGYGGEHAASNNNPYEDPSPPYHEAVNSRGRSSSLRMDFTGGRWSSQSRSKSRSSQHHGHHHHHQGPNLRNLFSSTLNPFSRRDEHQYYDNNATQSSNASLHGSTHSTHSTHSSIYGPFQNPAYETSSNASTNSVQPDSRKPSIMLTHSDERAKKSSNTTSASAAAHSQQSSGSMQPTLNTPQQKGGAAPPSPRQNSSFEQQRKFSDVDPMEVDRGRLHPSTQPRSTRSKSPSYRRLRMFPQMASNVVNSTGFTGRRSRSNSRTDESVNSEQSYSPTQAYPQTMATAGESSPPLPQIRKESDSSLFSMRQSSVGPQSQYSQEQLTDLLADPQHEQEHRPLLSDQEQLDQLQSQLRRYKASTASISFDPHAGANANSALDPSGANAPRASRPTRPTNRVQPRRGGNKEFLRHVQLPRVVSSFAESNCFMRVYRSDGTFGTIACPVDITADKLVRLAARKFFADETDLCRLVMVYPNRVRVLEDEDRPAQLIRNMLINAGFNLANDKLSDVIRDDTSFLCRLVFVQGDECIRPPTQQGQTKKELMLINTDVTDAPSMMCNDPLTVEKIDVSRSGFESTVTQFPHIKKLFLSDMFVPFEYMPLKLAHNLQSMFTSLSFLDLSRNGLVSLEALDFTFAPLLRHLDLRGNRLTKLPISLMHLPYLEVLECGTNELSRFTTWNPSLQRIDISYNLLKNLDLTFQESRQMVKLQYLNICANSLDQLPESMEMLPILRELDVRHNLMSCALPWMPQSLRKFTGSHNKPRLRDRQDSVADLRASDNRDSKLYPDLKELYIDHMSDLEVYYSYSMPKLEVLDLCGSNLPHLPESMFNFTPNMRRLDVSKNSLTSLPDTIANLRMLEELNVSKNSLGELPQYLSLLPELTVLDAHANNLKSIPTSLLRAPKLRVLNLSSNLLTKLRTVGSGSESSEASNTTSTNESGTSAVVVGRSRGASRSSVGESPKAVVDSDALSVGSGLKAEQSELNISPLLMLNLCDNHLSEDTFEVICQIQTIRNLDLSYNYLTEIPPVIFQRLPDLENLSVSGNRINTLPHDGFDKAKNLRVLKLNANRLNTLPAELSKASKLEVLDAGANQLRYNVANFPFDWNWRWNKELSYLNLSANRRLEIRRLPQVLSGHVVDLGDFCCLPKLVTLGLMDVTLTTNSVPFESSNCRVRTFGSDLPHFRVGIADSLGYRPLANNDLVVEKFRNNESESLVALFDGENELPIAGNRISSLAQEIFPSLFKRELAARGGDPVDALRRSFLEIHREIGNNSPLNFEEGSTSSSTTPNLKDADWRAGTGATVMYFTRDKLYIATVGGAHVVLSRANGTHSVLSKPMPPVGEDLARIRASGGVVNCDNMYVNNMSRFPRLIGCYTSNTIFSAAPSIYEYDIGDKFEVSDQIILASSAMWQVMGHETAADIARSSNQDATMAAMKLRDFAQAYGCNDSLMAIVVGRPQMTDHKFRQISDGDIFTGDSAAAVALRKRMEQLLPDDSTLARLGTEVSPPFGDVTMVFTDIRNSTYLWETYPPVMRSAIKTHNSLMRRSIRLMDGYEVKNEGDAFIISFHTPIKALIWCLTVQQHLLTAEWPQELLEVDECAQKFDKNGNLIFRGLSVRMGIHCGRPVAEPDPVTRRMDYFGPMVNRASRISGVAQGGQISVSADLLNAVNRTMDSHTRVMKGEQLVDAYNWTTPQAAEVLDRSAHLLAHTNYTVNEFGELKLRGIENLEHIYNIYPLSLASRDQWYNEEAHQNTKRKERAAELEAEKTRSESMSHQEEMFQRAAMSQQQHINQETMKILQQSPRATGEFPEDPSGIAATAAAAAAATLTPAAAAGGASTPSGGSISGGTIPSPSLSNFHLPASGADAEMTMTMMHRDSTQDPPDTPGLPPSIPITADALRRPSDMSLNSTSSVNSNDLVREQLLREMEVRKQVVHERIDEIARSENSPFDPFQSLAQRLEALCISLSGENDLNNLQLTLQQLEPPVYAGSDIAHAARDIWLTRIENSISRIQQTFIIGGSSTER